MNASAPPHDLPGLLHSPWLGPTWRALRTRINWLIMAYEHIGDTRTLVRPVCCTYTSCVLVVLRYEMEYRDIQHTRWRTLFLYIGILCMYMYICIQRINNGVTKRVPFASTCVRNKSVRMRSPFSCGFRRVAHIEAYGTQALTHASYAQYAHAT